MFNRKIRFYCKELKLKRLTINEEILLLSIWRLGEDAYGVPIRDKILETTDNDVGMGSLYNNLEQLVKKGYVFSVRGEPTAVRGGKRKVYYRVTDLGLGALNDARNLHQQLWSGVPEFALESKGKS